MILVRFGECSYSVVACRYVEVASLQIVLTCLANSRSRKSELVFSSNWSAKPRFWSWKGILEMDCQIVSTHGTKWSCCFEPPQCLWVVKQSWKSHSTWIESMDSMASISIEWILYSWDLLRNAYLVLADQAGFSSWRYWWSYPSPKNLWKNVGLLPSSSSTWQVKRQLTIKTRGFHPGAARESLGCLCWRLQPWLLADHCLWLQKWFAFASCTLKLYFDVPPNKRMLQNCSIPYLDICKFAVCALWDNALTSLSHR